MNWLRNLTILLLLGFFCSGLLASESDRNYVSTMDMSAGTQPDFRIETGEILYRFSTQKPNVLGVTIVNDTVVVSSAGPSSSTAADNYFYRFTLQGALIDSFPQRSTAGWGFRDLAYDGQYVLASDDNTVKKIDPASFQIITQVQNDLNSPHRGLAYDPNDNAIWSTNFRSGPLCKFDATTGETIRELDIPVVAPYGIDIDPYTEPGILWLWYAEPSSNGTFRLTKVDTTLGLRAYSLDLTETLAIEDVLTGGLEIINDHPDYPGSVIAVAVEQHTNQVLFVDISGAESGSVVWEIEDQGSFGGWVNDAVIRDDYAFVSQGDGLSVIDLTTPNLETVASLDLAGETMNGVIAGDYLYLPYATFDDQKDYLEIINIANPLQPNSVSHTRIDAAESGISKVMVTGGYAYLKSGSAAATRLIVMDVSSPSSPQYISTHSGSFYDFAVRADTAYILYQIGSKAADTRLQILDIANKYNFTKVDSMDIEAARKIQMSGDDAYLLCENTKGLWIYDLSDPHLIRFINSFGVGTYSFSDLVMETDYAYLKSSANQLVIVDISDIESVAGPQLMSETAMESYDPAGVASGILYTSSQGFLKSVNVIDRYNPEIVDNPQAVSPNLISDGVVYDACFYCLSGEELWIYDLADPDQPELLDRIAMPGANKLFIDGERLFVADAEEDLHCYDLANPLSPALLGSYTVGEAVIRMAFADGYAFVLCDDSYTLRVLDVSNPAAIALSGTIEMAGKGRDVVVPSSAKAEAIYVGYNKPNSLQTRWYGKLARIDVANPAAPALVTESGDVGFGDQLQRIDYWNGYLIVVSNYNGTDYGSLRAYQYAEDSFSQIERIVPSYSSMIDDLMLIDGMISVSLPSIGEVRTYTWNPGSQQFLDGATATAPEPRSLTSYIIPAAKGQGIPNSLIIDTENILYNYVTNGYRSGNTLAASKGISKFKYRFGKRVPAEKYTLFVDVQPLAAVLDGCMAYKDPFKAEYNPGETVQLTASPVDDWEFLGWQGAGANTNPVQIVMNEDKYIVANFGRAELTVSGSGPGKDLCVEEALAENQNILTVSLCASDADDWSVESIVFASGANGHEVNDIAQVFVRHLSENAFVGQFSEDNGSLSANFDPVLFIPKGQCAELRINYQFQYDPDTYITDHTKNFIFSVSQVNGEPVNFNSGRISGSASSDTLRIGRVINRSGRAFATLAEAQDSRTTVNHDSLMVCEGTLREDVLIHRPVTVIGAGNRDACIIEPGNGHESELITIGHDSVTVRNLHLMPGSESRKRKVSEAIALPQKRAHVSILGNAFGDGFRYGVYGSTDHSQIENNLFGDIDHSVHLKSSQDVSVSRNTFTQYATGNKHSVELHESEKVTLESNQGTTGLGFYLNTCMESVVADHHVLTENVPAFIHLSFSTGNVIRENENMHIHLDFDSDANQIRENVNGSIEVYNSRENLIRSNRLSGSHETAIQVLMTGPAALRHIATNDSILFNEISSPGDIGIQVTFGNGTIVARNTVLKAGQSLGSRGDGIQLIHCRNMSVEKNRIAYGRGNGIDVDYGRNIRVLNNRIYRHEKREASKFATAGNGIYARSVEGLRVSSNTLMRNCTGLATAHCKGLRIGLNNINDSFCWNTGIHLSASDGEIRGNNIINNQGNGIWLENGSAPVVRHNNIHGNEDFGVRNSDPSVTVDIGDNWWSDAAGPLESDIDGNLLLGSCLSETVGVIAQFGQDTLPCRPGVRDSLRLQINNLINPEDIVRVTISDENGWIDAIEDQEFLFPDSTGLVLPVYCEVPDGTTSGTSRISASVMSMMDGEPYSAEAEAVLRVYTPVIDRLEAYPDSVTVLFGQSRQLSCRAYDQENNETDPDALWSASAGQIDETGLFTADSTDETVIVTVQDTASEVGAELAVRVVADSAQLAAVAIIPDSVRLAPGESIRFESRGRNQYDFPHSFEALWETDGGVIDNSGDYYADSTAGVYIVTVCDGGGELCDTARVYVDIASGIDIGEPLPQEYALEQNYPNPFNPQTVIRYAVPRQEQIVLAIYDLCGRRIRTLVRGPQEAGYHSAIWDGRDRFGRLVSSGIYFYRLEGSAKVLMRRMLLLK